MKMFYFNNKKFINGEKIILTVDLNIKSSLFLFSTQ